MYLYNTHTYTHKEQGYSSVVRHLPSAYEVLGSVPGTQQPSLIKPPPISNKEGGGV